MDKVKDEIVKTERNIQMKTLSIATVIAAIGLSVVPTFASGDSLTSETYTINGSSEFALESALRDRGVAASHVEEWGSLVRAWVYDANGNVTMQFFDANTLQPVSVPRG
jgi:hypothetical protein